MHHTAFWLTKGGNTSEEYEDAFACDSERGLFAVADGATESSFSGLWATLLVERFLQEPFDDPNAIQKWKSPAGEQWTKEIGSRDLPWYAEVKFQQGAFSAFLGTFVEPASKTGCGSWKCLAVGDTCIFQIRDGMLIHAFPFTDSDEFGNRPWLLGSRIEAAMPEPVEKYLSSGKYQLGDRLLLMTDGLAEWFMLQTEAEQKPWDSIAALLATDDSSSAFGGWIDDLRESQKLRNDDVTLVVIDPSTESDS